MKKQKRIFKKYPINRPIGYNNGNYIEVITLTKLNNDSFLEEFSTMSDFDYCIKAPIFQRCLNCMKNHYCNFEGNIFPKEELQERIEQYLLWEYEEVL